MIKCLPNDGNPTMFHTKFSQTYYLLFLICSVNLIWYSSLACEGKKTLVHEIFDSFFYQSKSKWNLVKIFFSSNFLRFISLCDIRTFFFALKKLHSRIPCGGADMAMKLYLNFAKGMPNKWLQHQIFHNSNQQRSI